MKNPVPAIRAEFLERVGSSSLNSQPDKQSFTMEFDHYEVVPPQVSATIVAART